MVATASAAILTVSIARKYCPLRYVCEAASSDDQITPAIAQNCSQLGCPRDVSFGHVQYIKKPFEAVSALMAQQKGTLRDGLECPLI